MRSPVPLISTMAISGNATAKTVCPVFVRCSKVSIRRCRLLFILITQVDNKWTMRHTLCKLVMGHFDPVDPIASGLVANVGDVLTIIATVVLREGLQGPDPALKRCACHTVPPGRSDAPLSLRAPRL